MSLPVPHLRTAMTPFPYSVDVDADVESAARLMTQHNFRHLPVTERGEVSGMLTLTALAVNDADDAGRVRDHYDPEAYIVAADEPLRDVLMVMVERRLDAVIVTRHGKLAGVFTSVDACRALAALMGALEPHPEDNDAA